MLIGAIAILLIGLIPVEFESLCSGINNTFQCYDRIEEVQLTHYPSYVVRDAAQLRVLLNSGETVVFQDNNRFFYLFRSCDLDAGWCTLLEGANEYAAFLNVDLTTGESHRTWAYPVRSPEGEFLAVGTPADLFRSSLLDVLSPEFDVLARWDGLVLRRLCRIEFLGELPTPQFFSVGVTAVRWLDEATLSVALECDDRSPEFIVERGDHAAWTIRPASSRYVVVP